LILNVRCVLVFCTCFVLFCVFVFARVILSWCLLTWNVYIVYIILFLNISSIYMLILFNTILLQNFVYFFLMFVFFLDVGVFVCICGVYCFQMIYTGRPSHFNICLFMWRIGWSLYSSFLYVCLLFNALYYAVRVVSSLLVPIYVRQKMFSE